MKKILKITGMTCKHCVHHVTTALSELDGVTDVLVSLENHEAVMSVNDNVTDQALKAAVAEVGYTVTSVE